MKRKATRAGGRPKAPANTKLKAAIDVHSLSYDELAMTMSRMARPRRSCKANWVGRVVRGARVFVDDAQLLVRAINRLTDQTYAVDDLF